MMSTHRKKIIIFISQLKSTKYPANKRKDTIAGIAII